MAKQINCRYCGKPIIFGAELHPLKDEESINAKIIQHEMECENGEAVVNDVPSSNRLKKDHCGKTMIRVPELNPKEHIENALISISNLRTIARDLEDETAIAQCNAATEEVLAIRTVFMKKYRW